MRFGGFLGNETLKERLSAMVAEDKLSHCFLITGPAGAGKRTLARLLCAAMECTGGGERPCGVCAQCRKVFDGAHPDVCLVDDPEKKTIPVKLVRDACADLYIRPNEGKRKIYLFPRAQALNPQGQNALLKCIEEPPSYGAFLLLADHAERLLPTIRSRCVELRLAPLSETVLLQALRERFPDRPAEALCSAARQSAGYLGVAETLLQEEDALLPQTVDFVRAYCGRSAEGLLRVLAPMERLKREQLRPILAQWHSVLVSALTSRSGIPPLRPECAQIAAARTADEILRGIEALQEAMRLSDSNVGPGHICGALSILLCEKELLWKIRN